MKNGARKPIQSIGAVNERRTNEYARSDSDGAAMAYAESLDACMPSDTPPGPCDI